MSGVRYAEHAPPPALRGLVACGWTLESDRALPDHRVLPDGCIDLVASAGAGVVVAGPARTAFTSPLAAGSFAAGIRFRPGAAAAVLGIPAAELLDLHVGIADVAGTGTAARARDAAAAAAQAPDARAALAALRETLLALLPAARPADPEVLAAADALAADPSTRIERLARVVALSERQLRRRFDTHVGYGPKRLARVLRLQRLLRDAGPEGGPWARRALAAGYADQAHMVRECVELTGRPPTRLVAET